MTEYRVSAMAVNSVEICSDNFNGQRPGNRIVDGTNVCDTGPIERDNKSVLHVNILHESEMS